MSAFIKFNVGGESFQTTEETLLSEPNTLFHHILNGSWGCEKDSSGAILLDRDPRCASNRIKVNVFVASWCYRLIMLVADTFDHC